MAENRQTPVHNQDAFLSTLEADAKDRYERRKKNEKLSNELKDKGNIEFSQANYLKAIEYYTEVWKGKEIIFFLKILLFQGLEKLKDNLALYTNRAQAYIKLEKYAEALSDCEWAFRVKFR